METVEGTFKHTSRCQFPDGLEAYHKNTSLSPTARASSLFQFHLVYFVNCKVNENYPDWMLGMLAGEWGSKLPPKATLFIVATSRDCAKEDGLHKAVETISSSRKGSKTVLECHDDVAETYEYHGIHKAWQIGRVLPDDNVVVGYFHSKGVTHATSLNDWYHPTLTTMARFEQVSEAFNLFPWIEKAGETCGGCGWVWYNFWYARGSCLSELEEPRVTPPRHYYESWLGQKQSPETGNGSPRPLLMSGNGTSVWKETEVFCVKDGLFGCYSLSSNAPANMGYAMDPDISEDTFIPYNKYGSSL